MKNDEKQSRESRERKDLSGGESSSEETKTAGAPRDPGAGGEAKQITLLIA